MSRASLAQLVAELDRACPELEVSIRPKSGSAHRHIEVDQITEDSRLVDPSTIFCAIEGLAVDGHSYIHAAVAAGAPAVVAQRGSFRDETEVAVVEVSSTRLALAHLATLLAGHPSQEVRVVGVTGTNGKTTIVSLVEAASERLGRKSASMGTLTGNLTTESAPQFQAALRSHVNDGVDVLAAEVSSHALDQHRVDGTRFAVSIFTNLTQDHLDYHSSMEEYFQAKQSLFRSGLTEHGVVDVSDSWGRRIAEEASIPITAVDGATVMADAVFGTRGVSFAWREQVIELPLVGRFNALNATLAAEALHVLGEDPAAIAAALASVPAVPGRFEKVERGQPFSVIVDYSHTPASLEIAIDAARDLLATSGHSGGRVIAVFGAAGDRDPLKRPLMGAAGAQADIAIVTSDNPRTEDPDQIIGQVMAGMSEAEQTDAYRQPDRRLAIVSAVEFAEPGDVVLIAGKGHEDYQILGTTQIHFDDREVASEALHRHGWSNA